MYKKRPKNAQKPSSVYLQREEATSIYKIGVASDVSRRLKQNQTGNSSILKNEREFKFKSKTRAHDFEKALHKLFKPQHVRGEFYRLDKSDLVIIDKLHRIAIGKKRGVPTSSALSTSFIFKALLVALSLLALARACA